MIYVDADGCSVKSEIYKVANRLKTHVTLVANSYFNVPLNPLFRLEIVPGGFDSADDWIAENVTEKDLVLTADIPLADRCLKKGALVLGFRGEEFTENNIGNAVANREMMHNLREMNEVRGGPPPMDQKTKSKFLSKLDEILHRMKRMDSAGK